ncbi:MAG: hypothetical protein HC908_08380 [Calothrix sp. SM1_7_51]|nr:hypothetical protein [Calothrix sp. SM1_7_51]
MFVNLFHKYNLFWLTLIWVNFSSIVCTSPASAVLSVESNQQESKYNISNINNINDELAQVPNQLPNQLPRDLPPPVPQIPPPQLEQPPSEDERLKPPGHNLPSEQLEPTPENFTIQGFEVRGSTIFNQAELDSITKRFTGRSITFKEVTEVRDIINELYTAGCKPVTKDSSPRYERLLKRLNPVYNFNSSFI